MSEEIDKMAKARAAKKPPEYKNVHPDVKALDDDDYLSLKNVKEWEKHNKDRVKDLKYQIRRADKGREKDKMARELRDREAYLRSIATYLESATWLDLFYGPDQEHRMRWRVVAYSYDKDGYMKTKPLDFYDDVW